MMEDQKSHNLPWVSWRSREGDGVNWYKKEEPKTDSERAWRAWEWVQYMWPWFKSLGYEDSGQM